MNKELYDAFAKLDEVAKAEVKQKLKDSPIGLRLFEFLSGCRNRNFRNREVVETIYHDQLAGTEYNVLENRYFKLRKKFFEEYFTVKVVKDEFLADEELELIRIRKLLHKNEKDAALHALTALEKECWEKNIFELLPTIIDHLIFCTQLLNKFDSTGDLYKRMNEATGLQAAIYKVIALARRVYDINFHKGISYAKHELAEMKNIAQKHKEYPRFMMCYHHVSLYYKLGSSEYIEDMQVISRHFGKVKEFFRDHSLMPIISYRRNYNLYQQMHYRQMTTFYHYNRCEFEEAYIMMKEFWNNIFNQPEIYGMYKSASIFFNYFNCQRATRRYAEADETVNEFITFLKENKNTSALPYAYTLKAIIYADAWPQNLGMQPALLKARVDEYMREVKDDSNVQTSYGEALLIKARLLFLEKEYAKALQLARKPEAEKFMEDSSMKTAFSAFFNLYAGGNSEGERLEFKKLLSKEVAMAKKPVALMYLRWMQRMLERK